VGTPERPLSDLGRTAYHGYWTREILGLLWNHDGAISIKVYSGAYLCKAVWLTLDVWSVAVWLGCVYALWQLPHVGLFAISSAALERFGLQDISEKTAIRPDDVVSTLQQLGMIQTLRGQHVIVAAPHILVAKLKQVTARLRAIIAPDWIACPALKDDHWPSTRLCIYCR
jgi:hypothetical protein